MNDTIDKFKQQHFDNYKNAILDNIINNTNALTEEDIMSLMKKPPLDSMDLIKVKFLELAKKNKIILNTESLSDLLSEYRNNLQKCIKKVKKIRIDELSKKLDFQENSNEEQIVKVLKKDFIDLNKKIKKTLKDQMNISYNKLMSKIDTIFLDEIDIKIKEKVIKDISLYISNNFQKQLVENIDIKILIKDTTLINLIKEQTERYLFTLSNSRLFKDNI